MKYYLITDTHFGGPHPKTIDFNDIARLRSEHGSAVKLLGDIFDASNCRKSDWVDWEMVCDGFKRLFKTDYIMGNHCAGFWDKNEANWFLVENGIFFTHPTFIYSDKQMDKWFNKGGRGTVFRWFIGMKHKLVPLLGREKKLSRDTERILLRYLVANNCHTAIMGHYHVSDTVVYNITNSDGGIFKVVLLPRGLTEISL